MSQCTITVHWLYNSVHSTIAMFYYYYKNNPAFKEIGVSTYVHPSVIGLFQNSRIPIPQLFVSPCNENKTTYL